MEKQLLSHIKNIKSAFVRGKYDQRRVKDMLKYQISLTFIDNAIKSGLLLESDFKKLVLGKK